MDDLDDRAASTASRARQSAWKALAGAAFGAPVIVAILGAIVAANQDCDDGSVLMLALFPATGLGMAAWWARRMGAQGWVIALSALTGGVLAGLAGLFAWFVVSFDRCFVF